MGSSRRQFLGALVYGGLAASSGCLSRSRSTASLPQRESFRPFPARVRPHYVVQVILAGGFDSLLTVDAKDRTLLGDSIDCEYGPDARIRGAQRLFGPLIGGLARHDARLCLVHGVRADTVAHEEGLRELRVGKVEWRSASAVAADAISKALPGGAPIASLKLERSLDSSVIVTGIPCCDFFGIPPLAAPDATLALEPESVLRDAAMIAREPVPWAELSELASVDVALERPVDTDGVSFIATQSALQQSVVGLMRRVSPERHFTRSGIGAGLSIAFDAIANNAASFIRVASPFLWHDSHSENYALQEMRTKPAFDDLAAFVDLLDETRNVYGRLSEQTTLIVCSELGRYPKLNHARGKDHFPENSWIIFGAGIRGGITVGATDSRFQGVRIDYRTGKPDPNGGPITLDTMYATLLDLAGADPVSRGYARDLILSCMRA